MVFRPDAVSEETVSASVTEEAERRSRMVGGSVPGVLRVASPVALAPPGGVMDAASPQGVRPLVPLGMLGGIGGLDRRRGGIPHRWWPTTSPPRGTRFTLVAQLAFYAAAALGERLRRLGGIGYLPRFLVMQNLATLRGDVVPPARHRKRRRGAARRTGAAMSAPARPAPVLERIDATGLAAVATEWDALIAASPC